MRCLLPFAVEDPQAAVVQVEVLEVELDQLGAADAGVEQGEEDRLVARAHRRARVAAGEQLADVVGREGLHDALREADVAHAAERGASR